MIINHLKGNTTDPPSHQNRSVKFMEETLMFISNNLSLFCKYKSIFLERHLFSSRLLKKH